MEECSCVRCGQVWQREVKNHARDILVSFAGLRGMYRNLKEAVGKQCKDDPDTRYCDALPCGQHAAAVLSLHYACAATRLTVPVLCCALLYVGPALQRCFTGAGVRGLPPPLFPWCAVGFDAGCLPCRFGDCVEDIGPEPSEATWGLYMDSHFCMVPPGTSVRRAPFDAMLAGCIPIFFDHFFLKQVGPPLEGGRAACLCVCVCPCELSLLVTSRVSL